MQAVYNGLSYENAVYLYSQLDFTLLLCYQ